MHLLVDIRQNTPEDPIVTRYAYNWVNLWKSRHPGDTVSYIAFSHQIHPDNASVIRVPHTSWWRRPKPLSQPTSREIFRCINFSPFAPYDPRIETISHTWDQIEMLYPRTLPYLASLTEKRQLHRRVHGSRSLVVPSLDVGQEAVEIMHIREDRIEIIPPLMMTPLAEPSQILRTFNIEGRYWIVDGTYGSEMDLVGLLRGYKGYRDQGGATKLLIIGSLGESLRAITDTLRAMDLIQSVKMIGVPSWQDLDTLYAHASGWIYTGAYYGGQARIALAESYHLPLLLSDIPVFRIHQELAITIHPSHLQGLAGRMQELDTWQPPYPHPYLDNAEIMTRYEKILSRCS